MKIIIFGGTGFIGSHVVDQCRLAGETPVCPVREGANSEFLESIQADYHVCDFSNESLLAVMREADIVINCIARPELHLSLQEHRKVDVELTTRLFQQAERAGVRRFIQLSTVQVYGFKRPPHAIDEEYKVSADYHFNQVAIEREQSLSLVAENSRTELIILRPSNTVGVRDPNFKQIIETHKLGFFPIFKRGVRFSCVDTRDVGRAMLWLAQQETLAYSCYLLKAFDISWLQVKEQLDALSGKKAIALYLPEKFMIFIGYICEKLFPYGTHPPLIRFAVKVMSTNTLFDSSRIEKEGFVTSCSFSQMLKDYYQSLQR